MFWLGRSYAGEWLDLMRFKVNSIRGSSEFPGIAPEPCVKYFVIVLGVDNPQLENLWIDLLRQRSTSVDLHGIRYAWIVSQSGDNVVLKYTRVLDGNVIEDIGPYFDLTIDTKFTCEDELWAKATFENRRKKQRNVTKNEFNDKIGRVYVDRQDLRDISLKKSVSKRAQPE